MHLFVKFHYLLKDDCSKFLNTFGSLRSGHLKKSQEACAGTPFTNIFYASRTLASREAHVPSPVFVLPFTTNFLQKSLDSIGRHRKDGLKVVLC
jgi:hypothetical protein